MTNTKTTKTTKTTSKTTKKAFWIARAKKIAAARALNVKQGTTERQRRAEAKLVREKAAAKAAKAATKKAA